MSEARQYVPTFKPPRMRLEFDPQSNPARPWKTLCYHEFDLGWFHVFVPKGFPCDLASIPWALQWLFPSSGTHQRAALFHDGAYRLQYCTRQLADMIFEAILEADGVSRWRRSLLYYGVRLFGGSSWSANATALKANRKAMETAWDASDE